MAKKPISQQGMPPEFHYRPTEMLHGPPGRDEINVNALGSQGSAPIYPWMESGLDPIRWTEGGTQAMNETVHQAVDELTYIERYGQTPNTIIRKVEQANTVNTNTGMESQKPRPGGYDSVQAAVAAQKIKSSQMQDTTSLAGLAALGGKNRGWAGDGAPPAAFIELMSTHPTTAAQLGQMPKQREAATTVGGAMLSERQLRTMPKGLLNVLLRAQAKRLGQLARPPVAFDPAESGHLSTRGQYTTRWRPGLVPVAPGMYVRPEQVSTAFGQMSSSSGVAPTPSGQSATMSMPAQSSPQSVSFVSTDGTQTTVTEDPQPGHGPPPGEYVQLPRTPVPSYPDMTPPPAPAPPETEYVPYNQPQDLPPEAPSYYPDEDNWMTPQGYQAPQTAGGIPAVAIGIGAAVAGIAAIYFLTRKK